MGYIKLHKNEVCKFARYTVPSISEQKRIVELLKEVLYLVKRYDKRQDALNYLNERINVKLQKSILQEAIQGKLVPQIAEEGTAEKLLAEIRKEKERLVKEGKLKKSVLSDSVIYKGDDNKYYERINEQIVEIELPFEYPNSWVVLRLKDICQLTDGEKRTGKGICLDAKYLRGKSSAAVIDKGKFVHAGDNIILVDGENSGEVFSVPQDGYMGSTFKQLWLSSVMWKPYILAFILFYKEELKNSKRGAAIPHLNKELFYNLPIGIPPFAEQQRIAERITELSQLLK
ncbi:restriction endonuclease subunit S [Phocaeicola vulgatus]|uniref:restriction endonuclease subunit S n=1 Tax=Phocaeicola vulgatus TaxID=821 RepID=UPI0039B490F6